MDIETHSPQETRRIGAALVPLLHPGDVIALEGGLGSGKTELIRGFMDAVSPDTVVHSPSFSLVNTYETAQFRVHHFDFYRLSAPEELFEIGFDEYLEENALVFIEWAALFEDALPGSTHIIKWIHAKKDLRRISLPFDITLSP
ncbi:MAG: tRNA (adenosine(37)-N6)-threonylcarbamoyltransferase complex ATPase subunit type 1 TsaE [Fibrobacterota bacterium]